MSTPITYGVDAIPETRAKSTGFLAGFFARLIASREAQAQRYLVNYLSSLSDERLQDLGYTDAQIRKLRIERQLPQIAA